MSDEKSRSFFPYAFSPVFLVADYNSELGRAIYGVNVFKCNVPNVSIRFFVTDGENEIIMGPYHSLVVFVHIFIVVRKAMVRVVAANVLVVEPVTIIGIEVR